ncbi:MAG: hypothetical protein WC236_09725 [Gallionellaceae bacterium]
MANNGIGRSPAAAIPRYALSIIALISKISGEKRKFIIAIHSIEISHGELAFICLQFNHRQRTKGMEMQTCTTAAETFGMIAFASGIKAVPALDKNIMEMVANNPNKTVGASLPLLKAWIRGWNKANLA